MKKRKNLGKHKEKLTPSIPAYKRVFGNTGSYEKRKISLYWEKNAEYFDVLSYGKN
jgi:hypothetical protein